nr:hypothetical protein [Phycisphaerae bacterium]
GPMKSKPYDYYEQIVRMKHNADKFELRLRLVRFAQQHGVKPAVRNTPHRGAHFLLLYHNIWYGTMQQDILSLLSSYGDSINPAAAGKKRIVVARAV